MAVQPPLDRAERHEPGDHHPAEEMGGGSDLPALPQDPRHQEKAETADDDHQRAEPVADRQVKGGIESPEDRAQQAEGGHQPILARHLGIVLDRGWNEEFA